MVKYKLQSTLVINFCSFKGAIAIRFNWYYNRNYPTLTGFGCTGTESHLLDCATHTSSFYSCTPYSANDANVICPGKVKYCSPLIFHEYDYSSWFHVFKLF